MPRPIGRKLRDSFSRIKAINNVLHNDTLRCLNQLGTDLQRINAGGEISDHTRYLLKKTVRVFVGQVDGLAYIFRQAVVESADEAGLALTNRERAKLSERWYDKMSDAITDKPALLNTIDGFKLALKYFPRLFGSPYTLDTNGVAWRALMRLAEVRNGMMHPASLNEMSPVNAVPVLAQTITWFFYELPIMYADIAPRIGVQLKPVEPIPDPFEGFDERAHPWVATFSDQDHEAIAANRSRSLKYAETFLDHCHDERKRAIEEVGRHRGRHILDADYQSDVRNALCMVFATVEAMIFVAKRFVVAAESRDEITLSPEDHDALENGEVEDRLAAAMTLWSREFGDSESWGTTGEAWKQFRGARFRRNQLAHPKSVERLQIRVEDLSYLSATLSYYSGALSFMHLAPRWLALAGDPETGLSAPRGEMMSEWHKVVQELADLIRENLWEDDFSKAIEHAHKWNIPEIADIGSLQDYLGWINDLLYWVPSENESGKKVYNRLCKFYFILDQPPVRGLQNRIVPQREPSRLLTPLSAWMVKYAKALGEFLDTPESLTAESLQSFFDSPNYNMSDYIVPHGGWKTFNQFFARNFKPGLRPVAEVADPHVIISPADATFEGQWEIRTDSHVTVKNLHWTIHELLEGSPFKDRFVNGLFMHAFLKPTDYHRQHAPVGGTVVEARVIPGQVYLEVVAEPVTGEADGPHRLKPLRSFGAPDHAGYQFAQTRGLIVLDTPIGLLAVLPIGMCQVSSVIVIAEVGVTLRKGEELSYFQFGGSDIVMLFEAKSNVSFTAQPGVHYKMGTKIAQAYPIV